jgi:hypothetical protein
MMGAAFVAIRAGHARGPEHVARNAQLQSSEPNTSMLRVAEPRFKLNNAEPGKVDAKPEIKSYPMRMVRVRAATPVTPPIAGIPLARPCGGRRMSQQQPPQDCQ